MAAAEPREPPPAAHPARRAPPRGPGAPGPGHTPNSLSSGAGLLRLSLQGRPAATRIIPCAELPIRNIVQRGVEVELFGCWKAVLFCLGEHGKVSGFLSQDRQETALKSAADTATTGGRVRACPLQPAPPRWRCDLARVQLRDPLPPPSAPSLSNSGGCFRKPGTELSNCKLPPPSLPPPATPPHVSPWTPWKSPCSRLGSRTARSWSVSCAPFPSPCTLLLIFPT